MKRRNFITNNLALGAILPASYASPGYGSVKQAEHPLLNQGDPIIEKVIEGRLIFLFRLLKVDTLICYDPWGL